MSDDKKKKGLFSSLSELSFVKKLKNIKHIEIIIVVIFILILLLICFAGNNTFSFLSNKQATASSSSNIMYVSTSDYVSSIESKLKSILSNINGAGKVEVMISVDGSSEIQFATDETITTNGQTTEKTINIVFVTKDGVNQPIITSEKLPKINGVVVVSSGAKDTKVKLQLMSAVQTLINIDCDKIQILEGN